MGSSMSRRASIVSLCRVLPYDLRVQGSIQIGRSSKCTVSTELNCEVVSGRKQTGMEDYT